MAQKLTASMPEALVLDHDYQVRFTAVDASSGALLTSVKVENASLLVENLTDSPSAALEAGPFMLVPGPDA